MKKHPYKTGRKSILFISHDASHTGAPIFLLNFLKWFKKNTDIPFHILLREGGPLIPEFKSLSSVFFFRTPDFLPNYPSLSKNSHFDRVLNKVYLRYLLKKLKQNQIGLIYSNTITNGQVLNTLSSLHCPVITHVHEMEYWINRCGERNLNLIKTYTNRYIAVSKAVKDNLVINHSIPPDDVDVIYGFVPMDTINNKSSNITACRQTITDELDIPEDSFLIGASGDFYWSKSPDLFIQLAKEVLDKHINRSIHFIWIGGKTHGTYFQELVHDIEHLGIRKNIHYLGQKSNSLDYFSSFDLFALMSREDSFPLACLEAASVGTPILCFDNAGGAPEFVGDDAGFSVPYLDIRAMADRIAFLVINKDERKKMGRVAAEKVEDFYTAEKIISKLVNVIKQFYSTD
jgi:glycosyltransferase involved in cell wall biosynthesis